MLRGEAYQSFQVTSEALTDFRYREIQIFTGLQLYTQAFVKGFPAHTQYKNKKIVNIKHLCNYELN